MARYEVTKKKFFGEGKTAKLYGPGTKRMYIDVDKPFPKDKVPSGLVLVKTPTKAELTSEKKTADKQGKADKEKANKDKIEKDAVTFAGNQSPSKVQTL